MAKALDAKRAETEVANSFKSKVEARTVGPERFPAELFELGLRVFWASSRNSTIIDNLAGVQESESVGAKEGRHFDDTSQAAR